MALTNIVFEITSDTILSRLMSRLLRLAFLLLSLISITMAQVGGFGSFAPATEEIKTIFHTDEV